VQGDLDAAEADFQEADRFWSFANREGSKAPGAAQMLGLRASLRQDQHRFPKAISLLDRAMERAGAGNSRAFRNQKATIPDETLPGSSRRRPKPDG
jgi:hypothetical protein